MPHILISEEEAGEVVKAAKSSEKKNAASRAIMSFFSIAVVLGLIAGIIIMAKNIAKKLNFSYQDLNLDIAPDGELHVRFDDELKNKSVVLVQSFYPHPNQSLMEVLFAASTARDLGASKVILVAPWLDPDHEHTKNFFDDFEIDSNLVSRTKGITILYSDDDQESVLKTVEIIRQKVNGITYKEFHNYRHFCIEDMKTVEFPELLQIILD